VPLEVLYAPDEYLEMFKKPRYGYGKNMNPCIDCRIFLLSKAAAYMRRIGASFIATGEVVGERPMSQRRDVMTMIVRRAGLEGLVLRPLSAQLLDPTIPEQTGLVDREKLLDIRGRSRKPQMALAERYGITEYPSPAGGCLLTDPGFARRLADLMRTKPGFDSNDVNLLKVGRQFRLGPDQRVVIGRDEPDNEALLSLRRPGDVVLQSDDAPGPITLCRGALDAEALRRAAAMTARYSQARALAESSVRCERVGEDGALKPGEIFRVAPRPPEDMAAERIG
jgi:hypothetical protein